MMLRVAMVFLLVSCSAVSEEIPRLDGFDVVSESNLASSSQVTFLDKETGIKIVRMVQGGDGSPSTSVRREYVADEDGLLVTVRYFSDGAARYEIDRKGVSVDRIRIDSGFVSLIGLPRPEGRRVYLKCLDLGWLVIPSTDEIGLLRVLP